MNKLLKLIGMPNASNAVSTGVSFGVSGPVVAQSPVPYEGSFTEFGTATTFFTGNLTTYSSVTNRQIIGSLVRTDPSNYTNAASPIESASLYYSQTSGTITGPQIRLQPSTNYGATAAIRATTFYANFFPGSYIKVYVGARTDPNNQMRILYLEAISSVSGYVDYTGQTLFTGVAGVGFTNPTAIRIEFYPTGDPFL